MLMTLTAHPLGGDALMISPKSVVGNGEPDRRKKRAERLRRAVAEFCKLDPTMTAAQMQAFLLAAQETDMSVSEIAQKVGIKVSTASRYLLQLGAKRHEDDPTYELLDSARGHRDPRSARFELSRRGKALLNRVFALVYTGEAEGEDLQ